MKFSIIIPAHNSAAFIDHALASVAAQECKDYELIVVCDSCEDDTEKVARQYTDKVAVCDCHNDGMARNVGLEMAKGDYVLFLDSDDWYLHEYVLSVLEERIKENNADVVAFGVIWKHIGYVPAVAPTGQMFPHCTNKCWKRAIIGNTRFADVYPDSDANFHSRMMAKKPKIDLWPMPIYYYNFMRNGSTSQMLGRTVSGTRGFWHI